jgi:uncharacterized protein YggE
MKINSMKTLFIALVLFSCTAVRAEVQGLPNFPFLHVGGTASKNLPPDMAKLEFRLKVYDQKSEIVGQKLSACEQAIFTVLNAASISPADIIAGDISKEVIQARGSDYQKREIEGYLLERPVTVTIRDLKSLSAVYDKLLAQDNLEELKANFDCSDRVNIEASLAEAACRDARRKADALAKGFGRVVVSVYGISDNTIGPMIVRMENRYGSNAVFSANAGGLSRGVPSTITFIATVDALFVTGEMK